MGDIAVLIIIAAIWGISQLARRRTQSGGQRPAPRQRPRGRPQAQRPESDPRDQVTLEEWMERVRTGRLPGAPSREQEPRRTAPAGDADNAESILEEWRRRTQQPEQAQRETPVRTPPPTVQPQADPYDTPQERTRQAQQEQHAQARALAAERERERQVQERRQRARQARQARAQQRQQRRRGRRPVAVPRSAEAPTQEQRSLHDAPEHAQYHVQHDAGSDKAYRRLSDTQDVYSRPSDTQDVYSRPSERTRRRRLKLDVSRSAVRQGILMAEILGPPVALRQRHLESPFSRESEVV